ncbi:MAG: hypothetical protein PHP74_01455 [Candidatus Gracilibacteria bacterium]|nr:hypothetical protein [Candidatus Gracilibacteria bacterium]
MKKTSSVLLVGIMFLLLVGIYAGYKFWQKSAVQIEIEQLDKSLAERQKTVLKYENERVLQAISAKQTVDHLKSSRMEWSTVIKDVRNTLPKTDDGSDIVNVSSYSGSTNGEISISLKTIAGSENPFLDVAKLIASFDRSSNFQNPFVGSIGIGEDKNGYTVLSFSLTAKYLKADVLGALSEEKEVVENPDSVQIPRVR